MRRSLSFAVAALAVAAPIAAASAVHGCSSGEQFESVCLWVADPDNCYRAFREDTVDNGETCKPAGDPSPVDLASGSNGTQNGTFLGRDKLDVCFIGAGGQVVFDPPLDLTMIPPPLLAPPTTYKVTFKRPNGTTCGNATYTSAHGFTFTIDAPPDGGASTTTGDAGASTADAGDAGTSLPFGTYSQVIEPGRDAFDATCPSGETHHFNLYEVEGSSTTADGGSRSTCPRVSDLVPRAAFAINPGDVLAPGAVSLTIYWPPIDPSVKYPDNADASLAAEGPSIPAEAVTYFNCLIPAKAEPCLNGQKDGAETDVDCGGGENRTGCPARCGDGQGCNVDCDCDPGMLCNVVAGVRVCGAPTDADGGVLPVPDRDCSPFLICQDKVKNGAETGIDCGGGDCPRCSDGNPCNGADDCTSNYCFQGTCVTPKCNDDMQNFGEVDLNCGGPCLPCADGKKCQTNTDCKSGNCGASKTCEGPKCSDMMQNGTETDIDCGGTGCLPCENLKKCLKNEDCANDACVMGQCLFPSCTDNTKDGDETDKDCGGPCDTKCADGLGCDKPTDCASGVCGFAAVNVKKCFPASCSPTVGRPSAARACARSARTARTARRTRTASTMVVSTSSARRRRAATRRRTGPRRTSTAAGRIAIRALRARSACRTATAAAR
ncbi:Hypothetical protein A7982_06794 [Minicystis rosea]|nr:Hypothetical protein A7982_06794 [Minicystis rosea]